MFTEIEYDHVKFMTTKPQDLAEVMAMEQEEYNRKYVFSWSREEHQAAIDDPNFLHLTIWDSLEDRLVGYVILEGVAGKDRSIDFKRMVIDQRGQGYGRKAVRLLKKLCFEELKCHRLWLDVFTDNQPAINLYLSEGFIQEGLLRECKWSPEGFRSMLVMSILENEYK